MILLAFQYHSANLKAAWKFISVVLAIAQVVLNLYSREKHLRSAENVTRRDVRLADLGVLFFLMPSLGFNLAYAFGR